MDPKLLLQSAAPIALFLGWMGYQSLFTVDAGHRAIMFSKYFGVKDRKSFTEGTHFKIPWLDVPIIYNIRTQPKNFTSLTGTKDLQMINISLRVLFRPNEFELPEIYRNLGVDYDERVLPSIVNEVLKSVVAQFNASQLLTQREQISRLIRQNLTLRAKEFNIILDDVAITHLSFGKEFSEAIEAKQVAQQQAERAKFIVEQALQEKRSIIIRAQGEAKSAELIGQAIQKNPAFVLLRKIEASREIATTLGHSRNRVLLDANLLMLNFQQNLNTNL